MRPAKTNSIGQAQHLGLRLQARPVRTAAADEIDQIGKIRQQAGHRLHHLIHALGALLADQPPEGEEHALAGQTIAGDQRRVPGTGPEKVEVDCAGQQTKAIFRHVSPGLETRRGDLADGDHAVRPAREPSKQRVLRLVPGIDAVDEKPQRRAGRKLRQIGRRQQADVGRQHQIRGRPGGRPQALGKICPNSAGGAHAPIDFRRHRIAAVARDARQSCDPLDAGIMDQGIEDIAVVARDAPMAAIGIMQEHQDVHRASRRFRISAASSSASRQNQGLA